MKTINRLKIANIKAFFTKAAVAGLFAGAVFMTAPQKANAQMAVGIQFGRPIYRRSYFAPASVYGGYYHGPVYAYGPGYGAYGYDRHLEWERHERWEHQRGFYR